MFSYSSLVVEGVFWLTAEENCSCACVWRHCGHISRNSVGYLFEMSLFCRSALLVLWQSAVGATLTFLAFALNIKLCVLVAA